jgi:hypothetical protein
MSESGSEEENSEEEEESSVEESGNEENENEKMTEELSKKLIRDDLQLLADIAAYVHLTTKRIGARLPEYVETMSSVSTQSSKKKSKEKKNTSPTKSRGLVDRAVDLLLEDMDSTSLDESLKEDYSTVRRPASQNRMTWRGERRREDPDGRLSS